MSGQLLWRRNWVVKDLTAICGCVEEPFRIEFARGGHQLVHVLDQGLCDQTEWYQQPSMLEDYVAVGGLQFRVWW
jgi:hypothetical protein